MWIMEAARREKARKPLCASVIFNPDIRRVKKTAMRKRTRRSAGILSAEPRKRDPRTMSAFPSRSGATRMGRSAGECWPSLSNVTMILAPRISEYSMPVCRAAPCPRLTTCRSTRVAAGHGLVTSVCLYHQGLKRLPAKTNIYPLWPLLLGGAGRVMGMTTAARLLPRLMFLVDLLLLYLLTLRVAERTVGLNAVTWK